MKAIVLAAGKGTRLNSERDNIPKVMRALKGMHLIDWCLKSISFIGPKDTYIVVGYQKEKVMSYLGSDFNFVLQEEQLGTGHAVLCTEKQLQGFEDDILIIYGDMPLIKQVTLEGLVYKHKSSNADMTILTAVVSKLLPYGRIIRNKDSKIADIIEEKDVDAYKKNINELNVGVVVAKRKYLYEGLKKLDNNNTSKEYYLTSLAKVFYEEGRKIESYTTFDEEEIRGVNTLEDLYFAEKVLDNRI